MPARLENELKINENIEAILKELPEYVNEWHDNLYAAKKTASSRLDFVRKIRNYLEFINKDPGKVSIEEINDHTVTKYYISIGTKKDKNGNVVETSGSYQQNIYSALNNFLKFLTKKGYIAKNYIEDIERPKNDDLERINRDRIKFTKRDFKLVLHAAGMEFDPVYKYRNTAILKIFMTTGMRETALRIINISDIDFEKKTLTTIDKGRGGKFQVYNLNNSTIECIKNWLEYRKCFEKYPSDALFLSYQGERISTRGIAKIVDKYFYKALGKHVSPHKIRGGFISILYEETGDIEFVRRATGHSNAATTQRYISTNNDERERASEIMEF